MLMCIESSFKKPCLHHEDGDADCVGHVNHHLPGLHLSLGASDDHDGDDPERMSQEQGSLLGDDLDPLEHTPGGTRVEMFKQLLLSSVIL